MERKLAAIVAADVVGYSRMIRADEDGTLTALRALREEVVDPAIAERGGRMKVVGIESGDSPAFARAPYYDRDALHTGNAERIVVANYSLERDDQLPSGVTRVATVHVALDADDCRKQLRSHSACQPRQVRSS